MNCAEDTPLPTEGDGAYLGAAGFLAAVAYPEDWSKRDTFIDAVKAWHIKRALRAEAFFRPQLRSDLRAWRPRDIETALQKAGRRVNERLMAAQSLLFRVSGRQRPGNEFIAQQQAIHGIRHSDAKPLAESLPAQTEAARQRVWKRSLPVLHLAVALNEHTQQTGANLYELLDNPAWIGPVLERAEEFREPLEQAFQLPPTIRLYPE